MQLYQASAALRRNPAKLVRYMDAVRQQHGLPPRGAANLAPGLPPTTTPQEAHHHGGETPLRAVR